MSPRHCAIVLLQQGFCEDPRKKEATLCVDHLPEPTKASQGFVLIWTVSKISAPSIHAIIWLFPKIVVPQNGWLIMENPIKMDDFTIFGNIHIRSYLPGKGLCLHIMHGGNTADSMLHREVPEMVTWLVCGIAM